MEAGSACFKIILRLALGPLGQRTHDDCGKTGLPCPAILVKELNVVQWKAVRGDCKSLLKCLSKKQLICSFQIFNSNVL